MTNLITKSRPLFITFEGGEGVGKSTQIRSFCDYLIKTGIEVVMTREPGGCDNALVLRKLLVEGDPDRWDGISETLLYSTARNEHLRQVIRPEIGKGRWVICDRFADSTHVYQGEGRGVPYETLEYISNIVVADSWPDLTFILDMPAEAGLYRARGRQENMFETRFENIENSFHQRVRKGFLKIAANNPERCRVINADGSIEEVHTRILKAFHDYLQEKAA